MRRWPATTSTHSNWTKYVSYALDPNLTESEGRVVQARERGIGSEG